jgi:hypothetical protein
MSYMHLVGVAYGPFMHGTALVTVRITMRVHTQLLWDGLLANSSFDDLYVLVKLWRESPESKSCLIVQRSSEVWVSSCGDISCDLSRASDCADLRAWSSHFSKAFGSEIDVGEEVLVREVNRIRVSVVGCKDFSLLRLRAYWHICWRVASRDDEESSIPQELAGR